MGNYLDTSSYSCDDYEGLKDPFEVSELYNPIALNNTASNAEVVREASETLTFHIFSYKEYMNCKRRETVRWASAKLYLTEELIKRNQLRSTLLNRDSYLESKIDYLPEDELEEKLMDNQLRSLKNYRDELVKLINQPTAEKAPEIPILPKLPKRKRSEKSEESEKDKRRKLNCD